LLIFAYFLFFRLFSLIPAERFFFKIPAVPPLALGLGAAARTEMKGVAAQPKGTALNQAGALPFKCARRAGFSPLHRGLTRGRGMLSNGPFGWNVQAA